MLRKRSAHHFEKDRKVWIIYRKLIVVSAHFRHKLVFDFTSIFGKVEGITQQVVLYVYVNRV